MRMEGRRLARIERWGSGCGMIVLMLMLASWWHGVLSGQRCPSARELLAVASLHGSVAGLLILGSCGPARGRATKALLIAFGCVAALSGLAWMVLDILAH